MKKFKNILKLIVKFIYRPADVNYFLSTARELQKTCVAPWHLDWAEIKPMLKDRHESAGSAKGHYFLQDIWAARQVYRLSPSKHIDVGSRVDGFVANISTFCPEVIYVDIRPIETKVSGLKSTKGTIDCLPFADESIESLSCLHVLEHIGLGRYGDSVSPNAWKNALAELERVLLPGGQLLLGTPCGRERLIFHAHRVFAPRTITANLPNLTLEEFAYIENGESIGWIETDHLDDAASLEYGCGLFHFRKKM